MTTIAAIQGNDWVVVAGDSQSSNSDGFKTTISSGKIFDNNGIVFAMAGNVRGINILQHDFTSPKVGRNNPDKYITRNLIPAIRRTFQEAGYELNKSDSIVENDNIILVVINCQLYRIEEDYSWERCEENFYAAGSGESFCIGALSAYNAGQSKTPQEAEEILRKSITIAAKWDAFTGGKIISLTKQL